MATSGGQPGNQNASQKRPFWAAVNRVILEKKGLEKVDALEKIAHQLLDAAMNGEQWAIKELADRLDGRSAQQIIHTGDADNPVAVTEVARRVIK